jgi:hypothetical protein
MDVPSGFPFNKVLNQPNDYLLACAYEDMPPKGAPAKVSAPQAPAATATPEISAMKLTVTALSGQLDGLETHYAQEKANTGFVEHAADVGRSWLSGFLQNQGTVSAYGRKIMDLDASSSYVDGALSKQTHLVAQMKDSLDKGDTTTFKKDYQLLTGKDFSQAAGAPIVETPKLVDQYRLTNQGIHDFSLAMGAITAASLALRFCNLNVARGLMLGTAAGGAESLLFRRFDGYKSDRTALQDLTNGSFSGLAMGIGGLAGTAASEGVAGKFGLSTYGGKFDTAIQLTRPGLGLRLLSAGTAEGVNGAVYSAMVIPMRDYNRGDIHNPSDALRSVAKGAALGFGGAAFGLFRPVIPLSAVSAGTSGEMAEVAAVAVAPIAETKI